eukprot:3002875-Amphidinium_carterae.1
MQSVDRLRWPAIRQKTVLREVGKGDSAKRRKLARKMFGSNQIIVDHSYTTKVISSSFLY